MFIQCVCVCVCVCVFEDSKLSFHEHGAVSLQKNLKSINPTSKTQVFDCFGPRGLSYAPFATSGGMTTTDKS